MAAHRVELEHHLLNGPEQKVALFGQDEAARVAMEQGHFEILFERADLTADGRLAQIQDLAGVGEGSGICSGLKDPQLVPIHRSASRSSSALKRNSGF